jgi:uncharacterized protein YfaT (DUF1175 family)
VEDVSDSTARIRAGVLPAQIHVRVEFPNSRLPPSNLRPRSLPPTPSGTAPPTSSAWTTTATAWPFAAGSPSSPRRSTFRLPGARPAEIDDCAALIRYAYRETFRAHDAGWAEAARVPVVPAFDPPGKYRYPYTPLAAGLFRVRAGPLAPGDFSSGAFAQFADAQTLRRFNTHFLTRDLTLAQSGDLLFFRHDASFHSMIYLGASQLRPDGDLYVVYHTGPDRGGPGEIKRLTMSELLHFPQLDWRPLAANPNFLACIAGTS